jgi:hypothetical protein
VPPGRLTPGHGRALTENAQMVAETNKEKRDKALLDEAFETLEEEAPDRVARVIRWFRNPKSRWIRLPLGILFILASFFWFLPVIGIEFFPIGLLLIAQDVPFLRRPAAKLMIWLENKWRALREWWKR